MKTKINLPLVSVVITIYNEEQFITSALQSILDQTYSNLEIIVVDDASTDTTPSIIESFAKIDTRIRPYYRKKNTGVCHCSNFAFTKVQGDYIVRMDADDVSMPDRIEKQVLFMESHSDVVICGTQSRLINEYGKHIGTLSYPIDHNKIYIALFMVNPILHPSCIYRTEVVRKHSIQYDSNYPVGNDLILLFDFLKYGKLANLPEELLLYRMVSDSITHKDPKQSFWETVKVRHRAVKQKAYTPSPLGVATHIVEMIIVGLIPSYVLIPLYYRLRHLLPLSITRRGSDRTKSMSTVLVNQA
jgi:glycosyltransferase involved in cell wall biosynthesis